MKIVAPALSAAMLIAGFAFASEAAVRHDCPTPGSRRPAGHPGRREGLQDPDGEELSPRLAVLSLLRKGEDLLLALIARKARRLSPGRPRVICITSKTSPPGDWKKAIRRDPKAALISVGGISTRVPSVVSRSTSPSRSSTSKTACVRPSRGGESRRSSKIGFGVRNSRVPPNSTSAYSASPSGVTSRSWATRRPPSSRK